MTSIEWLIKHIKSDQNKKCLSASEWLQVIEQAKEMYKQEIIDAVESERWFDASKYNSAGEQYYNETFKKD